MTADDRSRFVDPVDDALTDLGGILHALDILRFEDALNKPEPECYALNVLVPLAIEKYEAARRAMEDEARARKATAPPQGAMPQ